MTSIADEYKAERDRLASLNRELVEALEFNAKELEQKKALLNAIITADTRYQSAQIALRADGRFANMQEAEVASEKMRAAIEDARKVLS